MRVFFDECVPRPLRNLLPNHAVQTAVDMGWGRLKNGELIQKTEEAGFEIFVTSDQNFRYQQNLAHRRIALLILPTNYWPLLRNQQAKIEAELTGLQSGQYKEVSF